MKNLKIILSGNAGSGKSTVGKMLAERLKVNFLSVGEICRQKAVSMGLDINQFQEYLKSNIGFDKAMDRYIVDYAVAQTDYILDYRLGFHFLPESFKILLKVSDEIAFQRISSRVGKDEDFSTGLMSDKIQLLRTRNELMRGRFIEIYGVDFCDEDNYDLVIDSELNNPEEIIGIVFSHLSKRKFGINSRAIKT